MNMMSFPPPSLFFSFNLIFKVGDGIGVSVFGIGDRVNKHH